VPYSRTLVGLSCSLLFGACAAFPQASDGPPKFDPAAVARGEKTFVASCGFCHGTHAKGGEKGPDLLRSVLVLDDEGGKSIGRVVLKGRPEKGMPKFDMTPDQITDIATFLHSSIAFAADRGQYKVLNIVTGDAKAGQAYFAGHCTSCHSVSGDLKGIGKKYEPVTLQDHIVMPRDRYADSSAAESLGPPPKPMLTVTVTPASGQAVTGTPVNMDDFNVALRDAAGNYFSFKRLDPDNPRVEIHNQLAAHSAMLMQYTDTDIHNLTAYLVTLK